jgi:hypothetical protein
MNQDTINKIMEWVYEVRNKKNAVSERKKFLIDNPLEEKYKKELFDYYNQGHGFKTIAKILNVSYTECRTILIRWLGLNYRKGYNVITNELRAKRSKNSSGEKGNFYNWIEKYPELAKRNTKSIQGWYITKKGKKVWLRSCLEYIYAKWLDKNDIIWKTEEKTLKYKNQTYRPDFFIYTENGKLLKIVEVKGNYFDNVDARSQKAIEICKKNNLKLDLVKDIKPYIEENSYYHKELKEWKLLQEQLKEKLEK